MIPHKTQHVTPTFFTFATMRKAFERRSKALQSTTTNSHSSYRSLNKPSKQIRLIEVKAQQPKAPLELNLSIHTLNKAPDFYAVSYTWGSGELSEMVLINGNPMMVTGNCYYALSQIHSHSKSSTSGTTSKRVYLWIDSICINQNDMKEKGYQVTMMFDIYSKAIKVLACVGPHENDSEILNEVLEETKSFQGNLYSIREDIIQDGTFTHSTFEDTINTFVESKRPSESFGIRLRKAVLAFANRDYWSRLWIIQEVAATSGSGSQLEVLCGTDRFSKSEVYLLFYIACYIATDESMQENRPMQANEQDLYKDGTHHCFRFVMDAITVRRIMAHQIFSFTNDLFKCSRPEDKIYGLLSLIKWRDNFPPLRPVYHDSASFDLAKSLICQTDWMQPIEIQRILKGLEICYSHGWMRNLVAMRSSGVVPTEDIDDRDLIHRFRGANHLVMFINKNDANQLMTSLVYSNDKSSPLTSVDKRAASLRKFTSKDDKTKLLFTDSEVSALVCGAAQAGDLIIKTGYGRGLLILRYTDNQEECTIVGQGLLCTGYEFPRRLPERLDILEKRLERFQMSLSHPKELSPFARSWDHRFTAFGGTSGMSERERCEKELGYQVEEANLFSEVGYMTNIQLKTKPVEMVVLAGQDIEKDGSHNVEESLQRLDTAICGIVRLIPMAN
ncbi:hypothetical protein FVEN_g90 [Fusarium venenatum]|uniref:heterokaryon incompatibility protein-domain-containing protein n=1 Tax=Fusarium venenatum TaxID=56646 RepID=UPI001DFFEE5D|nr:hypothetical protein FVEN_g90 [Fusarium venenatum]KAH6994711.1 heterokaryon incompatibility protein-domain-containing protein [Fusarium venenatum]